MENTNRVQMALENNEIRECIMGLGRYDWSDKVYMSPINVNQILIEIDINENRIRLVNLFKRELRNMIGFGGAEFLFVAVKYVVLSIDLNKQNKITYSFFSKEIFRSLSYRICRHKSLINRDISLVRLNFEGNIYSIFKEWNKVLKEKYEMRLFVERNPIIRRAAGSSGYGIACKKSCHNNPHNNKSDCEQKINPTGRALFSKK